MAGLRDELADKRRSRELDELIAQHEEAARESAEPVLADLRRAGFPVDGIGDLIALQRAEYVRAIPILLRWLGKTKDPFLQSGIARTLSSRAARPLAGLITPSLIEAFRSLHIPANDRPIGPLSLGTCKWTIGNAIAVLADDRVFEQLLGIAVDRRHGRSRQMVVYALGGMKDPRAVDVLIELLEDEEVVIQAAHALGRLKARKAKSSLQQLTRHPFADKEAKKALAKIEKAEEKLRRSR